MEGRMTRAEKQIKATADLVRLGMKLLMGLAERERRAGRR